MRQLLRRGFWLATGAIFLFVTSGCGVTRMRPVNEERARFRTRIHEPSGQRIAGFTLADGTYHEFKGVVRAAGSDSLEFVGVPLDEPEFGIRRTGVTAMRFANSDIAELRVVHPHTAGNIIVATLGMIIVAGVLIAATKESCPFIYTYDGHDYLFDGEPYGGATMSSLERTDWSELEHLAAVKGKYRLRLANEVDETQHTNSVGLLVADHPAGSRVVIDAAGGVHAFRALTPLSAARDEAGGDLLRWLRDDDQVAWYPDLGAFAARDSLADTRNHLTLTFPRPVGGDGVYLVANAGTAQWGSHQIRSLLSLRGERAPEFYAAINGNAEYHRQFVAWNEREELYVLGVELQEGDNWVRRGTISGGGPFISERRAIPLDLSGVTGDTVRLRLHPPIGFWRLNSFHLASNEAPASLATLPLLSARDERKRDVLCALLADDGAYLDFPTTRERAELVFAAPPPPAADQTRTLFAVTRGWYDIHLHADGPPDLPALTRLIDEPGFAVRLALREFAAFQQSGRLAWVDQTAGGF